MLNEKTILAIAGKIPVEFSDLKINFDAVNGNEITATVEANINIHPNFIRDLSKQCASIQILNLTPQ